jgi:hypothetical protein
VLVQMLADGAGCFREMGREGGVEVSGVECECGSLWVSRVGVSLAAFM